MKTFATLLLAAAAAAAAPAFAQGNAPQPAPAAASESIDGVVQKVDTGAKKLTIKHGEIKSLDMPPMTMVFQVRDAALLDKVKPGDRVRFSVQKSGGAIVVTAIQPI